MLATKEHSFVADAVFIPDAARPHEGSRDHVDPDQCVMLMVDGDNNSADVFTEQGWIDKGQPVCRRELGRFSEVEGGQVELLPELWIVKIDERHHWLDQDVRDACPRLYGVYVFDRMKHVHICSFEATYELQFLGTQFEETNELLADENRRDLIHATVLEGDAHSEQVTYWSKHDIDRMLETEIAEGYLPPAGRNGGYRLTGIQSVTTEDAIEEARMAHQMSDL